MRFYRRDVEHVSIRGPPRNQQEGIATNLNLGLKSCAQLINNHPVKLFFSLQALLSIVTARNLKFDFQEPIVFAPDIQSCSLVTSKLFLPATHSAHHTYMHALFSL